MVDGEREVLEYEVVLEVAICVPFLYILYPAIPMLSVEAIQVRLICELEIAVAVRPVGVEGAVVSVVVTAWVVNVLSVETARLPEASLDLVL